MTTINTSYSFSPQCDTRTGLSVGLTLLAALVTAAVFGVLAYKEYITPTIAYSAAPAIGATLILSGAAIALIRKEINPEQVAFIDSLESAVSVNITPYERGNYVEYWLPDNEHPYFFQTVRLLVDGKIHNVELESIDTKARTISFVLDNFAYKKTYTVDQQTIFSAALGEYTAYTQHIIQNKLLSRSDYLLLMGALPEGLALIGHGPALLFVKPRAVDLIDKSAIAKNPNPNFIAFSYPNNYSNTTQVNRGSETHFIFERDEDSAPPRSLDGLDKHPDVIAKLQATSWTWYLPVLITGSVPDSQTSSEKWGLKFY